MLFPLFGNRRKQILEEPFPVEWETYLDNNTCLYRHLIEEELSRLRDITKVLVWEKNWEGCQGLELTDEHRVIIAGQAALLIVNTYHDYFSNVKSILVYPTSYMATKLVSEGAAVSERPVHRLGEAWSSTLPVILSWTNALAGSRNQDHGCNVVLHEFAHKLDFRDGVSDGVPPLDSAEDFRQWKVVMNQEYETLRSRESTSTPGLIRAYGAKNPAEFFAVSTECFFLQPREMRHEHPDLYRILRRYFKQSPATKASMRLLR